jgi:hypothetical protein
MNNNGEYMKHFSFVRSTLCAVACVCLTTVSLKADNSEQVVNIKSFGCIGDGIADDTIALQKAIDAAASENMAGEIFIPGGVYRITNTLTLQGKQGVIFRGQGCSKFTAWPAKNPKLSLLAWDGEKGGILFKTAGIGGCSFSNLNFSGMLPGKKPGKDSQAGILYLGISGSGYGNMINRFSQISFFDADVGIQMARDSKEICASDVYFECLTFSRLGSGFKVTNDQGVNYLFDFLFAADCGTVLDLERGGSLMVNNAQLTCCGTFLNIGGGGRCAGVYLCQNVHMEGAGSRGAEQRWRLLKVNPAWEQANVTFINFADGQWYWAKNKSDTRNIPLCDIGAGANVVFQSSIFNSPVASINGAKGKPATFIARECSFGYVSPSKGSFSANEFGYFKTINCRTDNCDKKQPQSVLPDYVKWPEMEPVRVNPDSSLPMNTADITW